MADDPEVQRRIAYLTSHMDLPSAVQVSFLDRRNWDDLDRAFFDFPADQLTGWMSLAVDQDRGKVIAWMCPALMVATSARLPWSADPVCDEYTVNEDAMADPDDQHFTCPLDQATATSAPCGFCGAIHSDVPPSVHYEACDDPDSDPYETFDNYVRVVRRFLTTEYLSFEEAVMVGAQSTPEDRRQAAYDDLYRFPQGHPALHRFLVTVQMEAVDVAAAGGHR